MPRKRKALPTRFWKHLLALSKSLVLSSPPNLNGNGFHPRLRIAWTAALPKPKGFPQGRIISKDDAGNITMEHLAATVLNWLAQENYTTDSPAKIFAARMLVIRDITTMERGLWDADEKMLEDYIDKASEDI